jgi:hypothetical protein
MEYFRMVTGCPCYSHASSENTEIDSRHGVDRIVHPVGCNPITIALRTRFGDKVLRFRDATVRARTSIGNKNTEALKIAQGSCAAMVGVRAVIKDNGNLVIHAWTMDSLKAAIDLGCYSVEYNKDTSSFFRVDFKYLEMLNGGKDAEYDTEGRTVETRKCNSSSHGLQVGLAFG